MTDAPDPRLQAMFDAAHEDTADECFVAQVMADVDKVQQRTVIGWVLAGLLLAPIAWWLSTPMLGLIDLASQLMPESLIAVEGQWLAQLLAPVNGVSGIVGLTFLIGWGFCRKIFG